MAKVAYNNAKNASTSYMPFKLNCGYHLQVCYEKDIDPHSKSKSADKLSAKLQELITISRKNLHYA